jgi:hypothetical protein
MTIELLIPIGVIALLVATAITWLATRIKYVAEIEGLKETIATPFCVYQNTPDSRGIASLLPSGQAGSDRRNLNASVHVSVHSAGVKQSETSRCSEYPSKALLQQNRRGVDPSHKAALGRALADDFRC